MIVASPAVPAGTRADAVLSSATSTSVAGWSPIVTVRPSLKPAPTSVISVPPATGPTEGLTEVIVRADVCAEADAASEQGGQQADGRGLESRCGRR